MRGVIREGSDAPCANCEVPTWSWKLRKARLTLVSGSCTTRLGRLALRAQTTDLDVPCRRTIAEARSPRQDRSPYGYAQTGDEALLLDRARTALQRGMSDEATVTLMAHARGS